jgi:acyl-homoserine-lactone acylase
MRRFLIAAMLCAAPVVCGAEEVTIYRDTWGVPHIYAETAAAAAFGVGYAQAEDRLEDIYRNVRTATGTMAEAFGPSHLETDYAMRLVDNAGRCEAYYPNLPEAHRALLEAYVAGVKAYDAEHPEKRPEFALDLQPWHCLTVGRAMVLKWPLDTLMDDFKKKPKEAPMASNAFAVSPRRTADNVAMLLTDPHQSWNGLALFWEGRVHGGDLHMNGFFIVGSPLVGLGHNNDVGWAMTSGGADTSDVYMLKLNPEMPMQYDYNGEWKTMEIKMFSIPVKGEEKPRQMPAVYTIHGPLLGEPDYEKHLAYAGKTAYLEDMGVFEQMYAMVMAKDAEAFYEAIAMDHLMEQNIIYADRKGTIGYVRVGRTPQRPDGYDWNAPVPGWTSETEWKGIHPMDDHVRIVNPAQGYLQNCNVAPEFMMKNSPLNPADYPKWLYNSTWDTNNPRGKRMTQLLDANKALTKQEAMEVAMDITCPVSDNWITAVVEAVQANSDSFMTDAKYIDASLSIMGWNSQYSKASRGSVFIWKLRQIAGDKLDVDKISKGGKLTADEQKTLVELLRQAVDELAEKHNVLEVTWGDIFKVGRSGQYFPAEGADFGKGDHQTQTLRDVKFEENPPGSGQYVANYGQLAAMIMFFSEKGVESHSITMWGQSNDPNSPHHVDQARELYSSRTFKNTWNTLEQVKANLESEKTITIP